MGVSLAPAAIKKKHTYCLFGSTNACSAGRRLGLGALPATAVQTKIHNSGLPDEKLALLRAAGAWPQLNHAVEGSRTNTSLTKATCLSVVALVS